MFKPKFASLLLAGVLTLGVTGAAFAQASGGGVLRVQDGFGNPIGSTGTGTSRALNMTGGGGGLTSITLPQAVVNGVSGGIPCFTATTVMASSPLLTANGLMIGGGAGACPTPVVTGTGVLPALGINIGSAGSPVLLNGAGGTPSSLTLTNATGLPQGSITGLGTGVSTALGLSTNVSGGLVAPIPTTTGQVPTWNGTVWTAAASSGGISTITTGCPYSSSGGTGGVYTLNNVLNVLAKTTNYTSTAADCGAAITFTLTAPATFTMPAPGSVGTGFGHAIIKNDPASSASLTMTPAAGTINGAASLILPPGSSLGDWTDGANYFTSNGVGMDIVVFYTPGSTVWTPNPSMVRAQMGCLGGAGGGGAGGAVLEATAGTQLLVYGGGSGGSAASEVHDITNAQLRVNYATTVPVTVGAGGAGGAGASNASGTNGGAGGTSTIGASTSTLCYAPGGGAGGGGGIAGSAGGGGGGLQSTGGNATVNSGTGGFGVYGGSAGIGGSGAVALSNWCAGVGGVGGVTTTAAAHTGQAGVCTSSAPSGGGVSVASGAQAGSGGYGPMGVSPSNSIYVAGAVSGAGGSGQWPDHTFIFAGMGMVGGGSGGSGAACLGTGSGCTPGVGGAGGFGSSGAGGGAAEDVPTGSATGGAGGAGGNGAVQIVEFNR